MIAADCQTLLLIYRNRDKRDAMDMKILSILVLKIMFDAVSRVVIFSCWLYSCFGGTFNPYICLIGYYGFFAVLFFFNLIFNRYLEIKTTKFWIGTVYFLLKRPGRKSSLSSIRESVQKSNSEFLVIRLCHRRKEN